MESIEQYDSDYNSDESDENESNHDEYNEGPHTIETTPKKSFSAEEITQFDWLPFDTIVKSICDKLRNGSEFEKYWYAVRAGNYYLFQFNSIRR